MPKTNSKVANIKKGESVYIVKPALKMGGLDYLHLSLVVLVVILIATVFSLAYLKQGVILKNCPYGIVNSTCANVTYSKAQAIKVAQQVLAGYQTSNSSLALLPYYSLVNRANASYIPGLNQWLVTVPYIDPLLNNKTYNFTVLLHGANLTLASTELEAIRPPNTTNKSVVALGTIDNGKVLCLNGSTVPIFVITDPYAPGALSSIATALNDSRRNASLRFGYYFIFTGFSERFYANYSINETQLLGRFLACSSQQQNFNYFVAGLKTQFNGLPLTYGILNDIAAESGLNHTALNSCLVNSSQLIYRQAVFANYYNVVATPELIVACKYETISPTLNDTLKYLQTSSR